MLFEVIVDGTKYDGRRLGSPWSAIFQGSSAVLHDLGQLGRAEIVRRVVVAMGMEDFGQGVGILHRAGRLYHFARLGVILLGNVSC